MIPSLMRLSDVKESKKKTPEQVCCGQFKLSNWI